MQDAQEAMRDGIQIDKAKLAFLQQNKESLSLMEAMELAALEYIQKKQQQ